MSIPAIPGISAIPPISSPAMPSVPSVPSTPSIGSTGGSGFSGSLAGAVDQLQAVQARSDTLAVQASTGQLANPHDYLLASTEASLSLQLTVAVRNKALEAFNEIMRMPI